MHTAEKNILFLCVAGKTAELEAVAHYVCNFGDFLCNVAVCKDTYVLFLFKL